MKCPICNKTIKRHLTNFMEHTLIEEQADCSDEFHRYHYLFFAGMVEETIGNVTFHRCYTHSDADKILTAQQARVVLDLEIIHYHQKKGWTPHD